jgi:cytochrome P450
VICEILRLSSIVVGAILHSTTENSWLSDYFLPKGTIVMANLYNVHHDPITFPEPYNFNPERFLIKKSESKPNTRKMAMMSDIEEEYTFVKNENLVPFSVGKRVCLAEGMAQTEFFLFLTGLLQNFDFRFADEDKMPGMEDISPGLVLSPLPFRVVITERE